MPGYDDEVGMSRQARVVAFAGVVAVMAATFVGCTATGNESSGPLAPTPAHTGGPTSTASSSPPAKQGGTSSQKSQGASAPPTTPPTSTSGASGVPVSITMVMNGDVLLHEGLWQTARNDAKQTGHGVMDYRPMLANMRSVVRGADFAICHMETPLAPFGGPFSGYPVFSVPPQIVPALKWEGFDACTTMSNHSLDQGYDGIERTLADFDRIGLKHFGTVTSKAASKRALMVTVKGVKVALIGATYGTNGIPLPAEEPWSVPIINTQRILAMAHRAREDGVQIVIVALHWGLEYDHEPISDQITVADALTKSPDITFIYGHHAHVVQPYDKVNGTWVAYGQGNAIAQQDTAVTGVYEGNTVRVTFTGRPGGSFHVSKLQYIPTLITPYDYSDPTGHPMRWLDIPKDLKLPRYADLRPQMLAAQARVRHDINLLGALRHGVTEGS
jgi:poly-gamma-glutamate synthesis protein (capsule biosynthesis protein)